MQVIVRIYGKTYNLRKLINSDNISVIINGIKNLLDDKLTFEEYFDESVAE
jgi:hypothetical protein